MKRFCTIFLSILLFAPASVGFAAETGLYTKDDVSVKFSGLMRIRPEFRKNGDFNSSTADYRDFTGQRIRLNFKVKAGDGIDAFVSLQDARFWSADNSINGAQTNADNVRSSRENESVDVHQAWFKVKDVFGAPVDLKIGRQELVYGSQRLFGNLGWQDQARSFNAYKLIWKIEGAGQVDFISAKLKDTNISAASSGDQDVYGLYSIWKAVPNNKIDVYYLVWADASIGRKINTAGARIAGKYAGIGNGTFDYTGEYASQGGDWKTNISQSASALAVTAGYTFDYAWKTRFGLEFDQGSGGADGTTTTANKNFVFPFHTNHGQYGYMDNFSWGNMQDIVIKLKTKPGGGKTTVKLDYHMFKLQDAKGDWLNVVGTKALNGMDGASTYTKTDAGTEIDLTVVHPYSKRLKVVLGYSIFQPGEAVKERTGKDDSSEWGYAMFIMSF